jgi:hypothetical protein
MGGICVVTSGAFHPVNRSSVSLLLCFLHRKPGLYVITFRIDSKAKSIDPGLVTGYISSAL